MRLHLDGIIFSLQQHGGITVYFRELLRRFSAAHEATLTIELPVQQVVAADSFPGVRVFERQSRPFERIRACRAPSGSEEMSRAIFHSSYYRLPWTPIQPTVVTVHDFVAHRFPNGPRSQMRRRLMKRAINNADHIICISEATRLDLEELVPVRAGQLVSVIHNGVSELFRPLAANDAVQTLNNRPFALFVGQRSGYKNFTLALKALERLPELALHCVGGGRLLPQELACVSESTRGRVKHLGFVTDQQLNVLYNQAFCLLYPSAYEGFGIPVVEAMRAGCPVVSINCKAVVEVGGKALSVSDNADDPASLAEAVERLGNREYSATLRALGFARSARFSWDRCFEQTIDVYRGLAKTD